MDEYDEYLGLKSKRGQEKKEIPPQGFIIPRGPREGRYIFPLIVFEEDQGKGHAREGK